MNDEEGDPGGKGFSVTVDPEWAAYAAQRETVGTNRQTVESIKTTVLQSSCVVLVALLLNKRTISSSGIWTILMDDLA